MPKIVVKNIEQEFSQVFTCVKCNCNTFSAVPLHVAKYGGASLGYTRAIICTNCMHVHSTVDCDGKRMVWPDSQP